MKCSLTYPSRRARVPSFSSELLTALNEERRISWSPLVAKVRPFSLQEIFSSVNVGASQDGDLPSRRA